MQNDKPKILEGEFISALDRSAGAPSSLVLPSYPDPVLRGLEEADLIDLMINDEDCVPRNLIEECGRRGAKMEALLAPLFDQPMSDEEFDGHWWLRLHAINILGLIPSATAGATLLRAMQWLAEYEELDLGELCSGYWHAWFRNKPESVIRELQRLGSDKAIHRLMRVELLVAAVDIAEQRGPDWLEPQLDAMASLASDETENRDIRMLAFQQLLGFPRERHKALLDREAGEETGEWKSFTAEEVRERYESMTDTPEWKYYDDPLDFYSPDEIESRQLRVTEDDDADFGNDFEFDPDIVPDDIPYVRETPKIGRNDPCPCGSGKKYKKCCLG